MSEPTNTTSSNQGVLALSPDEARALTEVLNDNADSMTSLVADLDERETAADLQGDPTIDYDSQEYDDAIDRARASIQRTQDSAAADAAAARDLAEQIRETNTVDLGDPATLARVRSALDETGWSLQSPTDAPPEEMRRVMEASDAATTAERATTQPQGPSRRDVDGLSVPNSARTTAAEVAREKIRDHARAQRTAHNTGTAAFHSTWLTEGTDLDVQLSYGYGPNVVVELTDWTRYEQDTSAGTWRFTQVDEDLEHPRTITLEQAAQLTGITPSALTEALPGLHAAAAATIPHYAEARRERTALRDAEADLDVARTGRGHYSDNHLVPTTQEDVMTENPYLPNDDAKKDRYTTMARDARTRGTDTAALRARRVGLDPERAGDGTQPVRNAQQLLTDGRRATQDILAIRDRAQRDGGLVDAALENAIELNYANPWDNSPERQEAQAWITDALQEASRTENETGILDPSEYDPGHRDQAGIDVIRDNAVAYIERWEAANEHAEARGETVDFKDVEQYEQRIQEEQRDAAVGREDNEPEQDWELDSVDDPYTPERVTADWIQSNVMVNAYLEAGRPDLVHEWINTLDENLEAFASGGTPPGSDELYGVYHDAIAREAIPYGQAPISANEARRQLENIGLKVAPLDLEDIRSRTGIGPHDRADLTRRLETTAQQANEPSAALQEVASARMSVRRGLASIEQDGAAAREYLSAANTSLNSAVEELRPSGAGENVAAAHESVRQATERVDALTETSKQLSSTDAPETEQATRDAEAEVTIYTTPSCPGCEATKRALNKAGVEFEAIDLSTRPDLVAKFKKQGLAQSPIVETQDGDRWSGFNPSKLKEHGLDYRTRQQRGGDRGTDTGLGR